MKKPLDARPIKTVLGAQVLLTLVAALIFGGFWGASGAVSSALGGAVNLLANAAYAVLMRLGKRPMTAGYTVIRLLAAEAVKITVIVALLAGVLVFYRGIEATAFFVTFLVTALAFFAALLARTPEKSGSNEG